ncbi:MAG: hypothetical protein ACYDA0_13895 [Candidatus Dormibacteraceae bacterium]
MKDWPAWATERVDVQPYEWKERPKRDRSEEGVRYSLIVSIETPGQDVDIWTPVATEVGVPVVIET